MICKIFSGKKVFYKLFMLCFCVIMLVSLSACSGGGGSDSSKGSKWDEMSWDRGSWE